MQLLRGENIMKIVKKVSVLVFVIFLMTLSSSVLAAQGSWYSKFQFDNDGVSNVGTSNSYNETGHFTFRVVRATGAWIGMKNYTIAPNKSAATSFWGQPFLDRQGQVIINSRYWHSPWFTP